MKVKNLFVVTAAVALLSLGAVTQAARIYDSIPDPKPGNLPSQAYQATQTKEFGDKITFAGTERNLSSVTVGLSDWAIRSTYMEEDVTGNWVGKAGYEHVTMNQDGFFHKLTFNLYEAGANGAVGDVIATKEMDALIAWRPESLPNTDHWQALDGQTYHGSFTTATFDFSDLDLTLPDTLIYGLAINTNTWGYSPINKPGPYESLNFALSSECTVGSTDSDTAYINSTWAGAYTDGGIGGLGTFRQDTNWGGYVPAVQFDTAVAPVPEPGSILAALSILGPAGLMFRRRKA